MEAVDPSNSHDSRVPISIIAGKALVFNLDVIKSLRSLGIGGVLSGTLPTAPQQNIFLGIPLQLMVEEVIWLVTKGYAYLIPDEKFIKELVDGLDEENIKSIQHDRAIEFQSQKEQKINQLNDKLNSLKQKVQKTPPSDALITQSLFVNIYDDSNSLPNNTLIKSIYAKDTKLQKRLLESLNYDRLNYLIFDYLKSKEYFLAPGLRFGGKFIGYPGDPLRYHAHLIINAVGWDQDIGLMNIVNGGRLATGVKKVWLIGSEDNDKDIDKDDGEVVCFSVEWAGFG